MEPSGKNRRSSILKQGNENAPVQDIRSRRRVSFHHEKIIQEFDKDRQGMSRSPQKEILHEIVNATSSTEGSLMVHGTSMATTNVDDAFDCFQGGNSDQSINSTIAFFRSRTQVDQKGSARKNGSERAEMNSTFAYFHTQTDRDPNASFSLDSAPDRTIEYFRRSSGISHKEMSFRERAETFPISSEETIAFFGRNALPPSADETSMDISAEQEKGEESARNIQDADSSTHSLSLPMMGMISEQMDISVGQEQIVIGSIVEKEQTEESMEEGEKVESCEGSLSTRNEPSLEIVVDSPPPAQDQFRESKKTNENEEIVEKEEGESPTELTPPPMDEERESPAEMPPPLLEEEGESPSSLRPIRRSSLLLRRRSSSSLDESTIFGRTRLSHLLPQGGSTIPFGGSEWEGEAAEIAEQAHDRLVFFLRTNTAICAAETERSMHKMESEGRRDLASAIVTLSTRKMDTEEKERVHLARVEAIASWWKERREAAEAATRLLQSTLVRLQSEKEQAEKDLALSQQLVQLREEVVTIEAACTTLPVGDSKQIGESLKEAKELEDESRRLAALLRQANHRRILATADFIVEKTKELKDAAISRKQDGPPN